MTRQEWVIVGSAAAIVATQCLGAMWVARNIRVYSVNDYAYSDQLRAIEESVDQVAANTKSIDERLMPPGEYLRRMNPTP